MASQKMCQKSQLKLPHKWGNFNQRSMLPHVVINLSPGKGNSKQKSLGDGKNLSDNFSENFYKFFFQQQFNYTLKS